MRCGSGSASATGFGFRKLQILTQGVFFKSLIPKVRVHTLEALENQGFERLVVGRYEVCG